MAMSANYGPIDIGHIVENPLNKVAKLGWYGIAHGIRDIYCSSSSLNNRFQDLINILRFSPAGIHGRKLYIIGILLSSSHHTARHFQNLLTALLQLVKQVYI
ncbi:hypothetical protein ES703_52740 [subsurface metagenome]